MKNGTHPLYTLLRDPKSIATNGSTKKRTLSLKKKILLGCIITVASGVGIWQLGEYQTRERREQFITWVAKYRPTWSSEMIKAKWDKIQYARQHTDIVAPSAPVNQPAVFTPTPEPLAPSPGRATAYGLTSEEYKKRMAAHELTLGDVNRHNRGE